MRSPPLIVGSFWRKPPVDSIVPKYIMTVRTALPIVRCGDAETPPQVIPGLVHHGAGAAVCDPAGPGIARYEFHRVQQLHLKSAGHHADHGGTLRLARRAGESGGAGRQADPPACRPGAR